MTGITNTGTITQVPTLTELSQTGTISVIHYDNITGDYSVNIPTLLFIFSYIIILFFSLFFLWFTTLTVWKSGKKTVK